MGLFSSGGKGNSRANTSSTSSTQNTTTTVVDNSIRTSDFGAIQASVDISREVLDVGRRAFESAGSVADRSLETAERATVIGVGAASDIAGKSLTFARDVNRDSLDSVTGIASDALYDVRGISEKAINAVSDAGAGILDFASSIFGDAIESSRKTVEQNISGLTQLARETSQTADDRIVKVVMYSVGAAALAILGFAFLRSGSSKA